MWKIIIHGKLGFASFVASHDFFFLTNVRVRDRVRHRKKMFISDKSISMLVRAYVKTREVFNYSKKILVGFK